MPGAIPQLGICFSDRQLFYALGHASSKEALEHIGSFDFNFDVTKAFRNRESDHFRGICDVLRRLKESHGFDQVKVSTFTEDECWTTVPRLVYEKSDEREAHMSVIMKGIDRKKLEPSWFELSNQEFRFLAIRRSDLTESYQRLGELGVSVDLCSEFEIGSRWLRHTDARGSFIVISCYRGVISVYAYMLGKLRGATYIRFDDFGDLPYLWTYFAQNLKWMEGLYDEVLVYGMETTRVINELSSHWDPTARVRKLNSLDAMKVTAEETTYGFSLESAFPAIMMALNV